MMYDTLLPKKYTDHFLAYSLYVFILIDEITPMLYSYLCDGYNITVATCLIRSTIMTFIGLITMIDSENRNIRTV